VTQADLGQTLEWGDAEAFEEIIRKTAYRQGFGDTLAEGNLEAARIVGQNTLRYAMVTKGIEWGAHGVRSGQDMNPRSYSINTQGGDHCSTAGLTYDRGMLDDTLVLCGFWRANNEEILQFLNASTGFNITEEEMSNVLLPRWTTLQWAPLLMHGWTHEDNTNPPRSYEPLPSGPYKGLRVSKAKEQQMIQEAFAARGWDRRGVPNSETLDRLGLPYLEAVMKPYRSA